MITEQTIIALAGYARAGKDSLGAEIVRRFHGDRLAVADTLRDMVLGLNPVVPVPVRVGGRRVWTRHVRLEDLVREHGWEGVKTAAPEATQFLIDLGSQIRRYDESFLARALMGLVRPGMTVVTDVRDPSEYGLLWAAGALLVRVERAGCGPRVDLKTGRPSYIDVALDGAEFDVVVRNDGSLEELWAQVPGLVAAARAKAAG